MLLYLIIHLPPRSTLFPYTTLFRSERVRKEGEIKVQEAEILRRERELAATVLKDAEAQKKRIETLAEAERQRLSLEAAGRDRKSTRLNSSHPSISYAVFCLKKKKQ